MKWVRHTTSERDADWDALRAGRHRWGTKLQAARLLVLQRRMRLLPPPRLASAEEMRRAKWKMDYSRDETGRLR